MEEYSNSTGSLPTDILIEVFCRLPVKTLVQLQCVCKFWKNLICCDHIFKRSHLKQSIERGKRSKNNVLMYSSRRSSDSRIAPRFMNAGDNCLTRAFFLGDGMVLVGCINGVFCFSKFKEDYDAYLWNPALHQCWLLPRSRRQFFNVVGFVFEPANFDFKVVKITNWFYYELEVEIYSLRNNSWKSSICHCSPREKKYIGRRVATVHNEALHWLCCTVNQYGTLLMNVYDLSSENFKQTVLSDLTTIGYCSVLGLFNGCISVAGLSRTLYNYEIWVMKEYGEHDSWTKSYIFQIYTYLSIPFPLWSCWSTITRGKLVAALWPIDYHIILYDPETGGVEFVQNEEVLCSKDNEYFFIDNYVESLISVIPQNRINSKASLIKQSQVSTVSPYEKTQESLNSIVPDQDAESLEESSDSIVPSNERTHESSVSIVPADETTHEETLVLSVIPTEETTSEESFDSVVPLHEAADSDQIPPSKFCFLRRFFCCFFV